MEIPKYIVFRVDVMRKGTSVELTNITDEVEDVIFKADRKTELQTAECPFDDAIPCEWVCTEYGKCKYKDEPQTEREGE